MEERVIDYAPREAFRAFHRRTKRWAAIVAHRRAGKTVACINDLIRRAIEENKPAGRYAYVAPYLTQAKRVAWDYLRQYSQPVRVRENASELWVELINGSRIGIYGADLPNSLRGIYLDGAIADEYGDWKPGVWQEVLRPALSDRAGWGVFIGTPRGPNAFKRVVEESRRSDDWFGLTLKASETGILPTAELDDAQRQMTRDQFMQEYECSFTAAVVGAIYADLMAKAQEDGRICGVPHEPTMPVHTAWDLGIDDSTSIWFAQQVGREVRIIDYYEASGEGLPHYANVLDKKGYKYGRHWGPHDIRVRELGSGRSRIETALSLGIRFDVAPQQSVEDGIHAARMLLPRCWFDQRKCAVGIEALQNYRREINERLSDDVRTVLKPTPVHDWSSHAADAWRMLALSIRDEEKVEQRDQVEQISWMG